MKQLAFCMVIAALAGCAQLPANTAPQAEKPPVSNDVISFTIPPDALGARDPQLSAVLAKAGALAAAQMTVRNMTWLSLMASRLSAGPTRYTVDSRPPSGSRG